MSAAIALGVGLAAATVSGIGSYEQGQAASKASAYQSQVAAQNAQIATQNANFAGAEGEQNTATSEMQNRATTSTIKANQAANGVDVNSGSAVNVRASSAEVGELNALNIRANAARQAYGYETQASQQTGQSQLYAAESSNENTASYLSGAGSFLGGSSAALNFANFQNKNPSNISAGSADEPTDVYY